MIMRWCRLLGFREFETNPRNGYISSFDVDNRLIGLHKKAPTYFPVLAPIKEALL